MDRLYGRLFKAQMEKGVKIQSTRLSTEKATDFVKMREQCAKKEDFRQNDENRKVTEGYLMRMDIDHY